MARNKLSTYKPRNILYNKNFCLLLQKPEDLEILDSHRQCLGAEPMQMITAPGSGTGQFSSLYTMPQREVDCELVS